MMQLTPNKSFNPTPGNFRAGEAGEAQWRRGLTQTLEGEDYEDRTEILQGER